MPDPSLRRNLKEITDLNELRRECDTRLAVVWQELTISAYELGTKAVKLADKEFPQNEDFAAFRKELADLIMEAAKRLKHQSDLIYSITPLGFDNPDAWHNAVLAFEEYLGRYFGNSEEDLMWSFSSQWDEDVRRKRWWRLVEQSLGMTVHEFYSFRKKKIGCPSPAIIEKWL